MILDDQQQIVDALSDPASYPHGVSEVTQVQSHIAFLFLAGNYVYKLKRSVLYPDIDFSTPEKRKLACLQEMKRSTVYAPHLIIGLKPIKQLKNGKIRIGGKLGKEIDTVLVMKRIPAESILENKLPSPDFDRFEVMDLAEKLAELHSKAKTFHNRWGEEILKKTILENEAILSCFCPDIFDKKQLNKLTKNSLENLNKNARLITIRQKSGHVRKCHGDLLLSNIAYNNKKFLFFSPVEYSESMDTIDTLYDLAFLTMDLEAKGLRRLANMLFNHYMAYTNDIEGIPLMPLYQSMRAASRAAICAKKTTLLSGVEKEKTIKSAQLYFELACHFMTLFKPLLIACGGLSGSGKSRIAREIGGLMDPAPGAVILRDDVIRKQIKGINLTDRMNPTYNTPAFEKVVYDVLKQQAKTALKIGSCVILDALFYNEKERKSVMALAKEMKVPFIGLWMDAPLSVRTERVKTRKRNPSDVKKESELEKQLALKTGPITWNVILTDGPRETTLQKVIDILSQQIKLHLPNDHHLK